MDDKDTKAERRERKRQKKKEMRKSGRSFVVVVREAMRSTIRKKKEGK